MRLSHDRDRVVGITATRSPDLAISPAIRFRGYRSWFGPHPVWVIFLFGLMVLTSLLLLVLATIRPLSVSGNDSSVTVPERIVVTRSV